MTSYWGRFVVTLLWIIYSTRCTGVCGCRTSEDCLHQALFADYNVHTRPREPSENVSLAIRFSPLSLSSIDEKEEVMNLVGVFHVYWIDPLLQWNPSDYNGTAEITIPSYQVWLPRLSLINSATSYLDQSARDDFTVSILSYGFVYWAYGGKITTACSLDISKYPFDSQSCSLSMYIWGDTQDYVRFTSAEVDTSLFVNNSLWDLESTSSTVLEYHNQGRTYDGNEFTMNWKRKSLYYQFNVLLPVILLLMVSLGIFWLPPDCGERISVAITVLLAYIVFLIIIMDNTPINSVTVPLISQFVMAVISSTTFTLLESLLIVSVHFQSKQPPQWVRKFAFVYLACLFCKRHDVPVIDDNQVSVMDENANTDNDKTVKQPGDKELLKVLSGLLQLQKDKAKEQTYSDEWKMIAKLLDRLMFLITLTVTLIAITVIFA